MTLISLCPWCGKVSHPTKATALISARRRRTAARRTAYDSVSTSARQARDGT